jgi:hypothetical protein
MPDSKTTQKHDDVEPDQVPQLSLSGDFAANVTIIPTTTSSLLIGTATIEDSGVETLLPYIETKIAGVKQKDVNESIIENESYETLLSVVVSLDNSLFYVWDILRDIQVICSNLAAMSGSGLALEPARMAVALQFARRLKDQAEICVSALELLKERGQPSIDAP